ncbi:MULTISPECIES: MoaD/ThiS family protein [Pseudomonadaceae]|jgi:molybdopterin synthase sulfur carrier subunit|uniref:MoaD/ThiS family protein n=1 Tax=Pseudomonadaceae TaxID=135621 RepID=UPI000BAB97C9|nr:MULTISPECIES: MoaD/ThiS family protein [Pseudomonas]MBU3057837.1 MoaD/ThiS family protein [Pseudomonas indica]PAU63570.1 molybdopterin synthase sulfur carrier subunit [Pseudomonas indica]
MPVSVSIPTLLRPLTQDQKRIEIEGATVRELIERMDSQYPGIKERLLDGGEMHRFVNVYVNDNDIRFADNLGTALKDGDNVSILPAVAGG